jgi:hypothetical protein
MMPMTTSNSTKVKPRRRIIRQTIATVVPISDGRQPILQQSHHFDRFCAIPRASRVGHNRGPGNFHRLKGAVAS